MTQDFLAALRERVIIFDGAMGTSIQALNLSEDDFWGRKYEGCNELLVLSKPDAIRGIHAAFFAAGADVVETDTFGGTAIVLAEYELADRAYDLNRAAAQLGVEIARDFRTAGRPRWVSGSMGPGTKLPTLGHVTYDAVREAYAVQAQGLLRRRRTTCCRSRPARICYRRRRPLLAPCWPSSAPAGACR